MARQERAKRDMGRYISPEQASGSSSLQNVLGFFQEYIPQAYTGQKCGKETVLWAKFETSDCNDLTMEHHTKESSSSLLLFLGLSTGCTLWLIPPCSDAREIYSTTSDGDGCIRIATLLKTPDSSVGEDQFREQRPLLAVVRKGSSGSGHRPPYSTLLIYALRGLSNSRGDKNEVKRFEFERNSILDVKSNRRVIVVVLQKRLVVLDAASLEKTWTIKTGYHSSDVWTNPVALGTRWLAIADSKIYSHLLSMGGVSDDLTLPVTSTVMNTVKKGFAALSDTWTGLTGQQSQPSQPVTGAGPSHGDVAHTSSPPVVTVLDLLYSHNGEVHVNELRKTEGVIAHFLAHSGSVHVTMLKFNNSGDLLFTANSEGQSFNVFLISPSIQGSSDCKVQHLYSLYRGSTTGIVQDVAFSNDSRWIAVSTYNGTTHLFPICPYGGLITVRTHACSRVVNQLSRFHTSAGIQPRNSSSTVPYKSTSPVTVMPLQQIKQSHSSGHQTKSSGLSTTGDNTNDIIFTCVQAIFATPPELTSLRNKIDFTDQKVTYSLYIFGGDGLLTEYLLEPLRVNTITDGEDTPIELHHTPKLCWRLLSKPLEDSLSLPLDEDNPLIMSYDQYREYMHPHKPLTSSITLEEVWLSQVELLTYAPPTRRLWMGPQFTFKTVTKSHDLDQEDETEELLSPTAVLPPTKDDLSVLIGGSDLSLHSICANPVSMATPLSSMRGRGTKEEGTGPGSMPNSLDAGVEVFGSWNDIAPRLKSEADLEQQILDAMKDNSVPPSFTVISGHSSLSSNAGFNVTS